jgi:hypothetical protein
MIEEKITWVSVDEQLPDDGITVLACAPSCDSPVWFGFHENDDWFDVDGWPMFSAVITHWAEMPAGIPDIRKSAGDGAVING